MPKIVVNIGTKGETRIEVLEGSGSGCETLTRKIAAGMHLTDVSAELKPEYHEVVDSTEVGVEGG